MDPGEQIKELDRKYERCQKMKFHKMVEKLEPM